MKALLISSSGGHWVQMNRLLPAFTGLELVFASTDKHYDKIHEDSRYYYIPDASRNGKLQLLLQALRVFRVIWREKPDVVLTTGASVGFFALLVARKLGKKTIWVDSIANSDEISMSGLMARRHADLFLTQWEHLADERSIRFSGAVI